MEEIKRLKADDTNWDFTLAPETRESVDWLRGQRPDGWEAKVKAMEEKRQNYMRSELKSEANEKVRLLNERIAEIKRRMSGRGPL
jgi:hypothetical protein